MNTLDQRILIPAPPDVIWRVVGDLTRLPHWQPHVQTVVFLSAKRSGTGARWRTTDKQRKEHVIEVTTWYDGLGYEYVYVDGMPFKASSGRIRLQETADGTVVQWVLSYEVAGLLGGLRNSAGGLENKLEKDMKAGLRALYRLLKESHDGDYQSRALLRDPLDADARRNYKPRHGKTVAPQAPTPPPTSPAQPVLHLDEPPIADDDTRPRPAVVTEASSGDDHSRFAPPRPATPPSTPAVSVAPRPTPAATPDDDVPFHLPMAEDVAASGAPESLATPLETTPPPTVSVPDAPAPAPLSAEPSSRSGPTVQPVGERDTHDAPPSTAHEPQPAASSALRPASRPDETGEMSVFELFGVPKPSETQQMRAVTADMLAAMDQAVMSPPPDGVSQRVTTIAPVPREGLRARQRRTSVKVRRPG